MEGCNFLESLRAVQWLHTPIIPEQPSQQASWPAEPSMLGPDVVVSGAGQLFDSLM